MVTAGTRSNTIEGIHYRRMFGDCNGEVQRCKLRPHTTLQVIHQVPYRCPELLPAVEVQSF
jgi:hypothetical protein